MCMCSHLYMYLHKIVFPCIFIDLCSGMQSTIVYNFDECTLIFPILLNLFGTPNISRDNLLSPIILATVFRYILPQVFCPPEL